MLYFRMIAKSGKAAQIDLEKWSHRPSVVQGYLDHVMEGLQTQFIQAQEDKWEDFDVCSKIGKKKQFYCTKPGCPFTYLRFAMYTDTGH